MSKVVMKSSNRMILVIALAVVVFSAACSKNANTGNSTTSTNSSVTTNRTASTTSSSSASLSPTATLRAYWEAGMKKDVEGAKRHLSAGTLSTLEEGARKMGKTLDEAFKEGANQTPTTEMPEFSNEKIDGETATVDVKMKDMPALTMPLVKEGGEWKLALDKFMKDMQNSMGGDAPTKKPGAADDDDEGAGNHNGGH